MRTEREEKSLDLVIDSFKTIYGFEHFNKTSDTCKWDIEITGRTSGVIEVKERDLTPYDLLQYMYGLYMEKAKYEAIKDKNAIYTNYFNYGDIQILLNWNVTEINPFIYKEKMVKTSEFYDRKKVDKDVIKLSINDAICMLKFKDYDWKIITPIKMINQIKNADDNTLKNIYNGNNN